ncbi:hypothetical protein HRbin39_01278 [bacterium HR39]|nr:hypothetical protein HRbin39_01278 [bacterium HR39]
MWPCHRSLRPFLRRSRGRPSFPLRPSPPAVAAFRPGARGSQRHAVPAARRRPCRLTSPPAPASAWQIGRMPFGPLAAYDAHSRPPPRRRGGRGAPSGGPATRSAAGGRRAADRSPRAVRAAVRAAASRAGIGRSCPVRTVWREGRGRAPATPAPVPPPFACPGAQSGTFRRRHPRPAAEMTGMQDAYGPIALRRSPDRNDFPVRTADGGEGPASRRIRRSFSTACRMARIGEDRVNARAGTRRRSRRESGGTRPASRSSARKRPPKRDDAPPRAADGGRAPHTPGPAGPSALAGTGSPG